MTSPKALGVIASIAVVGIGSIVTIRWSDDQRAARAPEARRAKPAAGSTLPTTAGPARSLGTTPTEPAPEPVGVQGGLMAPVFYRVPTSQPVVFVTIDDGWVRDPRVVQLLRVTRIPTTLFLIDRAAREAPGYFGSLRAAGATVEDHTVDHPRLPTMAYGAQQREICQAARDLGAEFGTLPKLLRPPDGLFNASTQQAAKACGMVAMVEWTATMNDGRLSVAGGRLRPGDVVLLHFRSDLYTNLQILLQRVSAAGLTVGRLESYVA